MPYKPPLRQAYPNELYHHGILGQKWGIRRFQNPDGSLTAAGRKRYNPDGSRKTSEQKREEKRRALEAKKDPYYGAKQKAAEFVSEAKRSGWKSEYTSSDYDSKGDVWLTKDVKGSDGTKIRCSVDYSPQYSFEKRPNMEKVNKSTAIVQQNSKVIRDTMVKKALERFDEYGPDAWGGITRSDFAKSLQNLTARVTHPESIEIQMDLDVNGNWGGMFTIEYYPQANTFSKYASYDD